MQSSPRNACTELDQAYAELSDVLPAWLMRFIDKLKDPRYRWVRMPIAFLLIVTGCFGFLPIVGYEFIPLGLFLLAQDVPALQKPVGLLILWMLKLFRRVLAWWRRQMLAVQVLLMIVILAILAIACWFFWHWWY